MQGCRAALLLGCLDHWMTGCLTVWLPDCLAVWLPGCLACPVAGLPGCLACMPTCLPGLLAGLLVPDEFLLCAMLREQFSAYIGSSRKSESLTTWYRDASWCSNHHVRIIIININTNNISIIAMQSSWWLARGAEQPLISEKPLNVQNNPWIFRKYLARGAP